MKNLLKRKCPHCGQRPINIFRISSRPSKCPNCSGLVTLHFWRHFLVFFQMCLFLFILLPKLVKDEDTKHSIIILSAVIVYFGLYPLLVPVVPVPEEEGDITKEKKE